MKNTALILFSLVLLAFVSNSEPDLYLKVKKGSYYYTNAKGKKMIKQKFTSASIFSEGLAVVTTNIKYGVIDTKGKWLIPEKYYDIGDFHNGLAWYKYKSHSKYGYINSKDEKVIATEYDYVSDFKNGFAIVGNVNDEKNRLGKRNIKYYVINKNNELLYDSAFSRISSQDNSSFQCYIKKDIYKLDIKGNIIASGKIITITEADSSEILGFVEKQPDFPGGNEARFNFLLENVFYTKHAKDNEIQGTVYVTFVVEKDGIVTNVKTLKSPHPILSKESMRVVRAMPKWSPGMQNGKKVRTQFNMPLRFILAD